MRIILFTVLAYILFPSLQISAQELDVSITVNVPNIQNADPKVFKEMEAQLQRFMNSTKWTEDTYESNERIETNIQITITEEINESSFRADVSIQAIRPTFNSVYKTALITHQDKGVYINYIPFMEIENSKNGYFNNISSLLSFYAYMVLGYDYDSFAPLGGEGHFNTARSIVSFVPQNIIDLDPGWQSVSNIRNRFILLENLLNPRIKPYREAMYNYHRHGLDAIHEDATKAQGIMANALENIGRANRSLPSSMVLQVFANTKRTEIIDIMKEAESDKRNSVYQVMSKIDPTNISKYRLIRG